jgi:hypothetical protein
MQKKINKIIGIIENIYENADDYRCHLGDIDTKCTIESIKELALEALKTLKTMIDDPWQEQKSIKPYQMEEPK